MKTKMKSLYMVLAIVPLFMSCAGEEPSAGSAIITFDNGTSIEFAQGSMPVITGSIKSAEGTKFESIDVFCDYSKDGQTNSATIATMKDKELVKVADNNYTFRFESSTTGIKDHLTDITGIRIETKVKGGDTSNRTLTIKIKDGTVDPEDKLDAAVAFTWKRAGGAAGTGLGDFGLAWTTNSQDGFAIVKKEGVDTKLVKLDKAAWGTITTKAGLKKAIDDATGITDYRGVATAQGKTYDDVLGVNYNNSYILIHITKGTVKIETDKSATITIEGESKK